MMSDEHLVALVIPNLHVTSSYGHRDLDGGQTVDENRSIPRTDFSESSIS